MLFRSNNPEFQEKIAGVFPGIVEIDGEAMGAVVSTLEQTSPEAIEYMNALMKKAQGN